jgi:P2-related tail formation protein
MDSFFNAMKIHEIQKEIHDTSEVQDIEELVEEKEKKPRKLTQKQIFVLSKRNEKNSASATKTNRKNKSY